MARDGGKDAQTATATEATALLAPRPRREPSSASLAHVLSHGVPDGEVLPYNDYSTIDWLHHLVSDNLRRTETVPPRRRSIRRVVAAWWDSILGWIAAFAIGILTACVAFAVDIQGACSNWKPWAGTFTSKYAIYVGLALVFGVIAGSLTMLTKTNLPAMVLESKEADEEPPSSTPKYVRSAAGKTMYLAAGSGIPEIKTVLSGFVIPHIFDFKVLVVKAVGATFAVSTGMCLGKEGPFVHISACVGYLVSSLIPKYASNPRKMREMLSVACSAGLSVAFGAPIGGVLFSYEEISTYFPRRVLWRSFLCSLVAAATLKELNPTGTGKLVLFETNYGVNYQLVHYTTFCEFSVVQVFPADPLIKRNPVFELALVALITALLQYPNQLIRDPGDIVMERLLVDCNDTREDWICEQEAKISGKGPYYAWLISGTFVKLILTTITFGCKVPSGIIIPALDAGALFGRMVGQVVPDISPGIFAMVGSAAFLAGVSRMTVSLAVIMFELTGEWVADSISADGVYDLSQHLMGHPFLDSDRALRKVRDIRISEGLATAEALIRPTKTMDEIMVFAGPEYRISASMLRRKRDRLQARGLMDSGLVIVNEQGLCHGYLSEEHLESVLHGIDEVEAEAGAVIQDVDILDLPLSSLIDRNPVLLQAGAPLEYAVEMFDKLGLRYLVIVEDGAARVLGVVVKKRLLGFFDSHGRL
ncbi:unnamed protein product [Parascedosporium putredinis]|uniref:Chloride channel protein n=1 Tax=Parascedosporium putredinis TaxID=1442378 RepID=A0A9P1GZ73_9PEZI|nr:unnamed protein product [Parascedosporium putredinis]CAI7992556.1 unnamed protein product [Parascedosporium putredinis]